MVRDIVCSAWKHAAGLNSRVAFSESNGTYGCEANGELWNSGREADKEFVRKSKRSRRTSFTSNILVVSDPKNPDNEGKIFKFKYGKKIFDHISNAMQPPEIEVESGEATPINPFDLTEGANFKLKIRRVEGYANFDKSEFEKPSAVSINVGDLFDLTGLLDESTFKSYEELKNKFLKVTGQAGGAGVRTNTTEQAAPAQAPARESAPAPTPAQKNGSVSSDDDDMAFFRNLANGDSIDDDIPF